MSTGMPRSSDTFRDLALALTEEERRSLLKRITASLYLKQRTPESPFRSTAAGEGRPEAIEREIAGLGLWERLRFLLRRLFSTHGDDRTYVEFRLAGLRRRARSVCPALAPIERHTVSATVAEYAWELYRAAYPVIPLYLDLWKGGSYLQEAVEHLLSQRIPAARSDLYDFATLEELQESFIRSELKGDVRKLVVERLDAYLAGIPDELFGQLREGLLPFYYLREICLFDYGEFFDVFGFDPGIAPPEEPPPLRNAPTSAALPVVEGLYYALHTASRLESRFSFHSEVLDRYLEMKEREQVSAAEPSSGADEDERREGAGDEESAYQRRRIRLQQMRDELHDLHRAVVAIMRRVPFADLIRYYVGDPWLRIKPYSPELRLREFYRSYLMIRVLGQLDARFPRIRRGVVDRMVVELFGAAPPPLTFFRPGVQITPEKGGLPGFRHMRSLAVTYNFLRFLYRGRMQDMVRILSRLLPVRQRESSSDLIVHVSGLEETHADIEDFDRTFSPDSDDGKSYYRVRYAVESDITMQRSFRNLVQQRDRDAAGLVDRASEHVEGLARIFATVQQGLTDQTRERYASIDTRVNPVDGLDHLLDEQRERLDRYIRLIRQVRAMEEGY